MIPLMSFFAEDPEVQVAFLMAVGLGFVIVMVLRNNRYMARLDALKQEADREYQLKIRTKNEVVPVKRGSID
jgi:hypothetical protein